MSERETFFQVGDEVTVCDQLIFAGERGVLLEAQGDDHYWRVWMFSRGEARGEFLLPEYTLTRVGGRLQVGDRVVGLTGVHKDVEGTVVDTYLNGELRVYLTSLDWVVRVLLDDFGRLLVRRQDVPT